MIAILMVVLICSLSFFFFCTYIALEICFIVCLFVKDTAFSESSKKPFFFKL